jgi:hypothetical protein
MLAKGEKGVNGKCVLVCTKSEKEWSVLAQEIAFWRKTSEQDFS